MAVNREQVFAALADRLGTVLSGTAPVSRRVRHFADCETSDMPLVFVEQGDARGEGHAGMPTKWTVAATVYVYVNDASAAGPYPTLNSIVSLIEGALEARDGEHSSERGATTLGGVVRACRAVGVVDSGGALGDMAIAAIDVEMLTTS